MAKHSLQRRNVAEIGILVWANRNFGITLQCRKETNMESVLCINGSDSVGHAGIQADIRTIKDLGCYAVTAVTAVTIQNSMGITDVHQLPTSLVVGQVRAVYEEIHPQA